MIDELTHWAFGNPLGITVTGTVIAAAVIAIAARVSRGFRGVLSTLWSGLRRVRLTTEPRRSASNPLPPARWLLRPSRNDGCWILVNHGAGNAHSVQIDVADEGSMVFGPGFWKAIPGQHAAGVELQLGGDNWRDESTFRVSWRDDRKVAWAVHLDAHPRDRYKTSTLRAILGDTVVRVDGL